MKRRRSGAKGGEGGIGKNREGEIRERRERHVRRGGGMCLLNGRDIGIIY